MKRSSLLFLICAATALINVRAETETIDLKALAKKARPAVMLLVVSDTNGKEIATGTGFLVSSDGKLITNHHVIEGATSAVAKSENGGLFPVEGVLADDPKNDLVLLKIKAKDLPFLPLGDSEKIEVGTRIAIIGSPLGLEGTLSEGIVSAVREVMGNIRKLQITAAISHGSSGSPVMNAKGDVIGIAAAMLTRGQSLNLAVPVECGIRLLAKSESSTTPRPLDQSATTVGEDAIFSDPDWRAFVTSDSNDDNVERLKRAKVLVTRYPDNSLAWATLGWAFEMLNFTDDAIEAYQHAIKIKPDNAEAWVNFGKAYGQSGHIDEAVAAFRQAIKIKPNHASAWYNLGVVYGISGHSADAIFAYQQAVKTKWDYTEASYCGNAWYNLGNMYEESGRIEDGIFAYQQAVKIKPDYAEAWYNLGNMYCKSEHYDDALAAFHQAIKFRPNFAEAWYNLGMAYGKSGRTEDEITAYRQAIKIKPDYAPAWYNLGVAYGQSGRTAESATAFAQARKLKPQLFK